MVEKMLLKLRSCLNMISRMINSNLFITGNAIDNIFLKGFEKIQSNLTKRLKSAKITKLKYFQKT